MRDPSAGCQIRVMHPSQQLMGPVQQRTPQRREAMERMITHVRSHRGIQTLKERKGSPRGSDAVEFDDMRLLRQIRSCGSGKCWNRNS